MCSEFCGFWVLVWRVEKSHLNDASVSDIRAGGMIFSVDENGARAAEDMVRIVMESLSIG